MHFLDAVAMLENVSQLFSTFITQLIVEELQHFQIRRLFANLQNLCNTFRGKVISRQIDLIIIFLTIFSQFDQFSIPQAPSGPVQHPAVALSLALPWRSLRPRPLGPRALLAPDLGARGVAPLLAALLGAQLELLEPSHLGGFIQVLLHVRFTGGMQ